MIPPALPLYPPSAAPGTAPRREELRRAAQGMEGLFLSQLIKVMRGSSAGPAAGKNIMFDYADLELGRVLAERRGIGLAEMLYRSLARDPGEAGAAPQRSLPAPRAAPRRIDRQAAQAGRFYDLHVADAARRYRLDPLLLHSVIQVESAGRPDARSPKDAKGLMQLTDSTAALLGVQDVWDPKENIHGGARYLRLLLDRFDGDLVHTLAAYNAGPGAVERFGGVPPYPETRSYVRRVLDRFLDRTPGSAHDP